MEHLVWGFIMLIALGLLFRGEDESARWWVIGGVTGVLLATFLTGCTVQQQHPRQQLTAAKQTATAERPTAQPATTPAPEAAPPPPRAPEGVTWQPEIHSLPEPPLPTPRPQRIYRTVEPMAAGGKTITYRPGEKSLLYCPETGTLTIKFPAGETIQRFTVGAAGEWMAEKSSMGLDLPIGTLTLKRTPWAPSTELQVITDAEVYQFILSPSAGRVSQKHASLIQIVNLDTEARRAERHERELERMAIAQEESRIKAPQLDAAHLRSYQIGGDHVPWAPVSVAGDHQHTVIQLPAKSGAGQPTLTVIESGKEVRVNTRTLPEGDGMGPRIVVDQAFSEARLIGDGGTVSIVGR